MCFCETGEEIDMGCIAGKIEENMIVMEYTAYTADSDFGHEDAFVQIKYCPFCGKKLERI